MYVYISISLFNRSRIFYLIFLKTLMFTIVVSFIAWAACNILDVWYFAFLLFIIIIITISLFNVYALKQTA